MHSYLIGYLIGGIIYAFIVAGKEIGERTYQWKYILGTLLLPSVTYGLYNYHKNSTLMEHHTKKYYLLDGMWRVNLTILLLGLIPYEGGLVIFEWMGELLKPNPEPVTDMADLFARGTMFLVEGAFFLLILVYILVKIISFMLLAFIFVIVPRLMRPAY